MIGKRQHQEEEEEEEEEETEEEMLEPVLEFKARDGGWYAGTAAFAGPFLRVHFEHYSPDEDEQWQAQKFRSPQEVRKMIRPTSQPMQDYHCKELRRGMILCVACRHPNSDCFEYYDAKLLQLDRTPHRFPANSEECCSCQFEVEWLGGPLQHRRQFVRCGDICILTPGDIEDDPVIKEFIGKIKYLKVGKTVPKSAGSEAPLEKDASWTSKRRTRSPTPEKRQQEGRDGHEHSVCSAENEQKRPKISSWCEEIIDLDSEEGEDFKPLISRMKHLQEGSLKEDFPTQMIPAFDLDSHHRRLNGKEPVTQDRQSVPNHIPFGADLANQAVAEDRTDPIMVSSNGTRPDAKFGSSKSDYNTPMQSQPLPRERPVSSMEKPAYPPIVDRLHATSPVPNKASQQHTSIFEENTPPITNRAQQQPSQSPLVDESSNNDFSGLSKEQDFFQSSKGHISPCSCIAFQSSCYKGRFCHECGTMGFLSIAPLHLQTSMCAHASTCLREGHSECHRDSFKSGHHGTPSTWSQGGSKISLSQGGHTMQRQCCKEDDDMKKKPKTDGASKKEVLPKDVKVLSPSQFLLIENLEKDITPSKALKIVLKVSPGALMVYIWPSLEYETARKGYICYQGSQAADTAYSNFHAGKFMIISSKGRPWVVSRAESHVFDWSQLYGISTAATLKWEEKNKAGMEGMEDTADANGNLSILFKGTEEYTKAVGKQKLFLEQMKELCLCYVRFSKEERELEALS